MNFSVIRCHKNNSGECNEKEKRVEKRKRDRRIGTYNENAPDFTINTYNAKCVKLLITTTITRTNSDEESVQWPTHSTELDRLIRFISFLKVTSFIHSQSTAHAIKFLLFFRCFLPHASLISTCTVRNI